MPMIILPNERPLREPARSRNSLLTIGWVQREIERRVENQLRFHRMQQVAQLRSSCGVEPKPVRLEIRMPVRYAL